MTVKTLDEVAPVFVGIAHEVVWATVATVDPQGRPRSRVLHPYWEWDGSTLVGWIATSPTAAKREHLAHSPFVSVGYWQPDQDTATAECRATLLYDDETRTRVWKLFEEGPAPVGYDPAIVPPWSGGPTSDAFAALRLEPWRLRAMPGTVMLEGRGEVVSWQG
jgi:hypothetical protein